ncbi:MAG: diacylglycerol kinase family protein [Oscillospiraceae bacterium]
MKRFLKGFAYAAAGVIHGFTERNFRVHVCAVCFVSWLALRFYELSRAEWAVLLLTFAAVLSAELFNTSIERLCDKVSPEKDEHIRRCKDCAAGAVLVSAVSAVIIGVVLFWDIERFAAVGEYFCEAPARFVVLGVAVIVAAVFVFLPEKFKKR